MVAPIAIMAGRKEGASGVMRTRCDHVESFDEFFPDGLELAGQRMRAGLDPQDDPCI